MMKRIIFASIAHRLANSLACLSLIAHCTFVEAAETVPVSDHDSEMQLSMMVDCIPPYQPQSGVSGKAVLSGSTTMMLLGQEWANKFRKYHPTVEFARAPEGLTSALDALKSDPSAIAGVGHMVTAEELQTLQKTSCKDPAVVVVGLEPIAILVNDENPLSSVTPAQLQAIFAKADAATTWGQIGATGSIAGQPVRLHLRSDMNSSKTFIESTLLGNRPATAFAATHRSQGELLEEVAKDVSAVAIGGIRDANGVKPLAININGKDVLPSSEMFMSGEYPLVRPLTLVFDRSLLDHDNGLRREILNYVLSRQGQMEVLRAGFFPVNPNFIAQQIASLSKSQLR